MISVRLRLEVTTPTGEVVKRFPIGPGELVIPGISTILASVIKQIDVNGKTYEMEAVSNPFPSGGVQLCLHGTTDHLSNGTLVTLRMDIVEKTREEPREEAPLLT